MQVCVSFLCEQTTMRHIFSSQSKHTRNPQQYVIVLIFEVNFDTAQVKSYPKIFLSCG